jgi:hypothetical protein
MTVDEVKYNLEEFKSMVRDNLSFIEIKKKSLLKLNT